MGLDHHQPSAKAIDSEVSNIRTLAFDALHSDSKSPPDYIENKFADEIVKLHCNPKLEHAVLDKLATPDPTKTLPVADVAMNEKGLQAINFVPGSGDSKAPNAGIKFLASDLDYYANRKIDLETHHHKLEHE
jgi:hypothetical protein